MARTAAISLRVDPDLKEAIEKLAADDERPLSQYIERVLREHAQSKGVLQKAVAKQGRKKTT